MSALTFFFWTDCTRFEQTFRDFCCSLSCAHADSAFVIDDTVPNDVYSALPDETDTRRFRRETGSSNTAWHGDVFKIVFAVHDFFQNLSYCTINTGGNPQTLVWRRQRHEFNPKFSSLEAISRLSYFDLRKNLNIMRMCDESSGIETLISSLKRPHPS